MKGEFGVGRSAGSGTSVWFTIETRQLTDHGDEALYVQKEYLIEKLGGAFEECNILIVDDLLINRSLLGSYLSTFGIKYDAAENGKIAYEKAEAQRFDLIFMDIQMPIMDGVVATVKIRNLSPELSKLPIIAVTAHNNNGDRDKYIAAGFTDHMEKPVNRYALYDILTRYLPTIAQSRRRVG